MKLYRLTYNGHFVPTQDAARARVKTSGGSFYSVDVPERGRETLADFLNDIVDEAAGQAVLQDRAASNVIPLRPEDKDSARPDIANKANEIVAFLLDEAEPHHCENILAALGTRVGEMAKAARQ